MELNTSQPQHSQIVSKPSRNPILYIVIGVVLITLTALGLLVWQKNQEISTVLSQLSDTEKRLTESMNPSRNKATDLPLPTTSIVAMSENEQKTTATSAAADYYCGVSDFGCDKVSASVTDFQKLTVESDGFAKVVATNAAGSKLTVWLKHRIGGSGWAVFYEGQALPSAAITKQFSIPTDFLAVD